MDKRRFVTVAGSVFLVGTIVATAVAQVVRPAAVLHDLAGRDDCLMCHEAGVMEAVTDAPANHSEWESTTCLWCHGPDSPLLTSDAPLIPHELAGRDDCLMCHAPGAMDPVTDTPASHEGRASSHCQMCHSRAV